MDRKGPFLLLSLVRMALGVGGVSRVMGALHTGVKITYFPEGSIQLPSLVGDSGILTNPAPQSRENEKLFPHI